MLDPSTGSRIGKALIPRGTPSGEQGSIRQVAPGRGWTLQVSRHETLEKARNCVNYRPTDTRMEGFGSVGAHIASRHGPGLSLSTIRR